MVKQGRNAQTDRSGSNPFQSGVIYDLTPFLIFSLRMKLHDPRITLVCTRLGENGLLKGGLGLSFSPTVSDSLQSPSKHPGALLLCEADSLVSYEIRESLAQEPPLSLHP